MSMGWVAAGTSIIGGLMSSNAAGDAADAQRQSVQESNALQKAQFDQTRADNAGYRARGDAAGNQLANLLGLTTSSKTRDQLRAELAPGFTSAGTAGTQGAWNSNDQGERSYGGYFAPGTPGTAGSIDEAGLSAAIERQMATQAQQQSGPGFGSLLKPFTGDSVASDPGYQFGLQQGTQAVDRSAASRGGLYSGATLKALQRYGQDYGGTKFGEAFNRDQVSKNQQFNMLSGISGTGQAATNQVNSAGQNYAQNAGNNITSAGSATASGYLTQGNAWQNALNGGVSAWKNGGTNALSSLAAPWNANTTIPMQPGGGY